MADITSNGIEGVRPRVFVGRRSLCMGDDINCPNMYSFYLTDDLDEFKKELLKGLPISDWEIYLGYPDNRGGKDHDIVVSSRYNSVILFTVKSDYGVTPKFTLLADNWYELLKNHPYLYCS